MARVSVKAVLIGVGVDFGLSVVFGIATVFIWDFFRASRGRPMSGDVQDLMADTGFLVLSLVVGFATLAVGGFVAGKIAARDQVLNGAVVGATALAIGFLMSGGGYPRWFAVTARVLDVPVAVLGAVLARRTKGNADAERPAVERSSAS